MTTSLINKILAGTLGVQLLFVAIAWWPSSDSGSQVDDLIPVDAAELSRISITGRILKGEVADQPVVMERKADGWILTSSDDYPVDDANLDDVFEQLDKLVLRSPIATQAYSHAAMDVADDQYSRRIEVDTADGQTITFFLGSAEGKSSHVRRADTDEVYRVRGISAFGIPDQASRYFNRDFQKVDASTLTELTIERPDQAPIRFVKDGDAWTLPDLTPEGKELDPAQANAFVSTAVNFRMLEPHGKIKTPEMGLDTGIVVSWSGSEDGASISGEYRVGAPIPDESGRRYVKASHSVYIVEVLEGQLAHAMERGVDDLFRDPVPTVDLDEGE